MSRVQAQGTGPAAPGPNSDHSRTVSATRLTQTLSCLGRALGCSEQVRAEEQMGGSLSP